MKKLNLFALLLMCFVTLNVKAGPQYGFCGDPTQAASNPHCTLAALGSTRAQIDALGGFIFGSDLNEVIKGLEQGIAVSSAIASIPKLDRDKIFSIGVGFGGMDGRSAAAVGATARVTDNFVINGNVGHGLGSNNANINTTVWGAGGALSW